MHNELPICVCWTKHRTPAPNVRTERRLAGACRPRKIGAYALVIFDTERRLRAFWVPAGMAFVLCGDLVGVIPVLGRSAGSAGHRIGWTGAVLPVDRGGTRRSDGVIGLDRVRRDGAHDGRSRFAGRGSFQHSGTQPRDRSRARQAGLMMRIPGNSQLVISEISFPLGTLVGMREASGERARLGDGTRLEVPTVFAQVVEGVITAPDLAYVSERLHQMCREYAGRVRRARARLFGPGPSGVTFAEATLILRDGSTVSEPGDGPTTREAVDLVVSRLARQLRTPRRPPTS
jgi:hypothetical protein